MSSPPLKIVYLTSGAAGMYCGSCLNDNSLAKAMTSLGHDVQLVPLYTPIRTDSEDVSIDQVFFGGINVYLQQQVPLFRYSPRWLDRVLDQPWIIRLATGMGIKTDYKKLGPLAVSMLRGDQGFQRKEVVRLAEWLAGDSRPDIIIFSNVLTAGCVPQLRKRMPAARIFVTLQGDDIFLRELPQPFLSEALTEVRRLAQQIDGFLSHSQFYADEMAEFLGISRQAIRRVPLGVEVGSEALTTRTQLSDSQQGNARSSTIGYLARLAPEKGLHVLADAFIRLKQQSGMENTRLRIAGWLGERNRAYANETFAKLRAAGLGDSFEYVGEVDRAGKQTFLQSIDLLSVPTTYQEPKGLFVLEALAAGVPVVVPNHGSFPETLAELGGGVLHRPGDAQHLAETLGELLGDDHRRRELGRGGQIAVHRLRKMRVVAERTVEVLRET